VAVNPRTRDAIYRCVGSAGVVLIAEGSRTGTKTILDEEVRKLKRATPGVSIHVFYVTGDESGTPLAKLGREITGLKRTLNRNEVSQKKFYIHETFRDRLGAGSKVDFRADGFDGAPFSPTHLFEGISLCSRPPQK
jgi:hypothetical protein